MSQSPDLIATAVKMFIVLGILMGVLIASLYLVRRTMGRKGIQSKGKMIKVLASNYIGVKKNISLVAVPGAVLVLGVTADQINLLAKIDDPETLREMSSPEYESGSLSFSDHIRKISSRYKKNRIRHEKREL